MQQVTSPAADLLAVSPGAQRKRLLRAVIGLPLLGVVCYFVGKAMAADFREINWSTFHVNYPLMFAAVATLLLVRVINGINCHVLLRSLGHHAELRRVMPVIWVASLGRYIPFKVSAIAGSLYMLVRLGIRVPVAMSALFLSTALMMLTGLLTSLPLLLTPMLRDKMPGLWMPALAILIGAMICLHPRIFARLVNLALTRFKGQPLPTSLHERPFYTAVLLAMLRGCLLAVAMWFTIRAVNPIGVNDYPLVLGSVGLASVAGFLAVFAPAGLGVHEGIYMMTLTPLLGPQAGLCAVLFRLLHLIGDSAIGVLGIAMMKSPYHNNSEALNTGPSVQASR